MVLLMRALVAFIGMLLCTAALAGGRGGHNTTFDPALFPGATVSCLTAAVAGTCATGYNATCNGVADDSTPLKNWLAAALAANPARAVLYIPPGKNCHFASVNNFVTDTSIAGSGGFQYGGGVRNAVVWAYGATSDAWGIVGEGFGQNNLTSARIATVSAGSSTVTLVNGGDASKFAVGNWICVTGLTIALGGGYPQNFQFFEYHLVTAISGATITLESPLTYAYKSTWPVYQAGGAGSTDFGGPATIYLMGPSWNTNIQVYGLGFRPTTGGAEVPSSGRNIAFYDISFGQSVSSSSGAGPAPSMSQSTSVYGSSFSTLSASAGMEVDKVLTNLTILNSVGSLFFQSASPTAATVTSFRGNVSGTPLNATFQNSTVPSFAIGPNCYGHGNSLALDGVTVTSGSAINCFVLKSAFTYSSGTFTISDANAQTTSMAWAVPGQKYFFGFAFGSTTCNAGTTFTITDVTQDGSGTHYVTDLVGALPTPACDAGSGSQTYDRYVAYPAATITQRNSTGTNMTVFAAP